MSLNQLSMLLGLPDSDCKQILDYGSTLSKTEAADHFKNLLGDSPQAIEFISSFNSRRQDPKPAAAPAPAPATHRQAPSDLQTVPKQQRAPKKKKAPLRTPAPRQITDAAPASGTVYSKKTIEDDYIAGRSGASTPSNSSSPFAASAPKSSTPPPPKKFSKQPPSAAGSLVSDRLAPKQKPKSNPPSRSSTPGPASRGNGGPATKVSIAGGTPMHGASTAVADLDAAIRSLEVTTNPSLSTPGGRDDSARRCNCVATRHPLQSAAPNCLSCGKVVCLKEGLGPCTSCGAPLLSPGEVQSMIRELRAERGREKQAADRDAHRRADVAAKPRPFTKPRTGDDRDDAAAEAEARALEHRDRLLGFQAQNARRTTVRDEAADFDVSGAMAGFSGSLWASPEDRARELKRQQKLLREMEWSARPDYEKRQQVVSIDLVGGKVVKKFVAKERPATPEEDDEDEPMGSGAGGGVLEETSANRRPGAGGAFSRNPLLGGMIRPVYDAKGKGAALEGRKDRAAARWRRVQDDLDDNEALILDGGVYGGQQQGASTGSAGDEPDCG
ncbi:putative c2hc5 finger protein [Diaporthe ampelina]|uniref:Putative c2hc5 finger protein n=1 Tax=Diaporthe ampelina TaxID=1214573 RepID=A0A0G2HTX4_9PEZI|nr:putative c2hc5 finger protein [Diaporthe ampelina]